MEPCLVWFPTCPCMWLSIALGPPQQSLRVGCSFYGYCSARGRAVGWMLGLAGPASPSGSARKLDREPVRAGAAEQDKEGRENSAPAGYRGCPQQVSLRTGFRKG